MHCDGTNREKLTSSGIDIIAYDPFTKQRLGITVKSRTKNPGKEETTVNIFSYRKGKNDRGRLLKACEAFACEPWIGVYVETAYSADLYLTSLQNYDARYRAKPGKAIDVWKMKPEDRDRYDKDPDVKHIAMEFRTTNWWSHETLTPLN